MHDTMAKHIGGHLKTTTLREQAIEILLSTNGWVPRLRLVQITGFDRGFADLMGPADGPGKPKSLKAMGYVEVKSEDNRVSYRLTPEGRRFFEGGRSAPNNWQKTVLAVQALGGQASREELRRWLLERFPGYNDVNLRMDLDMLSVNVPARRAHIKHPAVTDPRNALMRVSGKGEQSVYVVYDPELHGVWVARAETESGLTQLPAPAEAGVSRLARTDLPEFDPDNLVDGKEYVNRAVAVRRGQFEFRQSLLDLYGGECCISGCRVTQILEAAHILPFSGDDTHHLANGLLLRADLHTLFDLGLLRIDPATLTVEMHPLVMGDLAYQKLDGGKLKPVSPRPSAKSLIHHRDRHLALWTMY